MYIGVHIHYFPFSISIMDKKDNRIPTYFESELQILDSIVLDDKDGEITPHMYIFTAFGNEI